MPLNFSLSLRQGSVGGSGPYWYYFMNWACLALLQEDAEAQAKADKIKLALEKLKEAKVKKVDCGKPFLPHPPPSSSFSRLMMLPIAQGKLHRSENTCVPACSPGPV